MRILIVSFYYAPELGAAPSRITNLAEGLKSQGAEVEVLTCLPNYPKGRIFEGYRHRIRKTEIINGINGTVDLLGCTFSDCAKHKHRNEEDKQQYLDDEQYPKQTI